MLSAVADCGAVLSKDRAGKSGKSLGGRLLIVLGCALLATLAVTPVAAAADPPPLPPYQITTQPADLSKVQDGDQVRVTIAGLPAGASATLSLCPDPLRDNLVSRTAIARVNAYCLPVASETVAGFDAGSVTKKRNSATGEIVLDYTVVRGATQVNTVSEKAPGGATGTVDHDYSYRCDEANPCALWLLIGARIPPSRVNTVELNGSVKVAPLPSAGVPQGCADPDQAASFTASLPERLGKTSQRWNELLCAPTGGPTPAASVRLAEGEALAGFDGGQRDVAFTGSGTALSTDSTRKRVHVPAALNAAVVAVVGTRQVGTEDNVPNPIVGPIRDEVKFDWPEVAEIAAKRFDNTTGGVLRDGGPAVTRNQVLADMAALDRLSDLGAMMGRDTVPLLLSDALADRAPEQWKFSTAGASGGAKAGKPVGVLTDFLDLSPGQIPNVTRPATTKVGLRSAMKEWASGTACGNAPKGLCAGYVLTDLATATEFGWTPIALPNSAGEFVSPTPQSLAAGAAHLAEAEDGTLRPGDTGADPGAYPLTFVEYAVAPENPLVDSECRALVDRQRTLAEFLGMLAGAGQDNLGPGLVKLTPQLAELAKQQAAKVGGGTMEGACAELPGAGDGHGAAAGDNGPGTGSGPGLPASGPGPANGPAGPAADGAKVPTPATVQEAKKLADSVQLSPPFAGGVLGALIPLLALAVLVMLPSATAYLAAGRPVPPRLLNTLRRFGSLLPGRRRTTEFVPA